MDIAKKEYPKKSWLHRELRNCTNRLVVSDDPAMIYFVTPQNANQLGSEWQHEECIESESYEKGSIVVDILKNHKIGAIELIWLIKE